MKRTLIVLLILQLLAIVCFLYFCHQADLAMGKDGIGDIEKCNTFNSNAGISFYSVVVLWLSVVFISLIKRQFKSKEAQLAIGVPPVVILVGWLLFI
jgi:ABC-type branched-subunit amino acid transport system permease subunit